MARNPEKPDLLRHAMFPSNTPPPKGWSSRHDLSVKQLVPVGDDNHYEMRYPPSQPKDISADSFSVSATLAAGGNLQPAGNLFHINPLNVTEVYEAALENYIEHSIGTHSNPHSTDKVEDGETQPGETQPGNTQQPQVTE